MHVIKDTSKNGDLIIIIVFFFFFTCGHHKCYLTNSCQMPFSLLGKTHLKKEILKANLFDT